MHRRRALQVASACPSNSYCQSFNNEDVSTVPKGDYCTFPFNPPQPCTPGSICALGQKQDCPSGFQCPDTGMFFPARCNVDESLSFTCFDRGLKAPSECLSGTLCGTPFMPPLPAPPGYVQNFTDDARTLSLCSLGMWCGLGRASNEGDNLLCPANTSCNATSLLEPVICNVINASSMLAMPYCPAGTFNVTLCPAGKRFLYCT